MALFAKIILILALVVVTGIIIYEMEKAGDRWEKRRQRSREKLRQATAKLKATFEEGFVTPPARRIQPIDEGKYREMMDRMLELRRDHPNDWARIVSHDEYLTKLVLAQQQREQQLLRAEKQLREVRKDDPPPPEPEPPKQTKVKRKTAQMKMAWVKDMCREEQFIKKLYPDPDKHESLIEMLQKLYMEGES